MSDNQDSDDKEFLESFGEMSGAEPEPKGEELQDGKTVVAEEEAEAGKTEKPAETPAETPPSHEDDLYAGLDPKVLEQIETLRKENENLVHRARSDSGRLSALQQKVNQLERDRQEGGAAGPTSQQLSDAMASDEAWKDFAQEYPEMAGVINARLEGITGEVNKRLARLDAAAPLLDRMEEREKKAGYDKLDSKYTGWRDRVRSPEYLEWIQYQDPAIQAYASSDNVDDAASLIQAFDRYLTATGKMDKFNAAPGGEKTADPNADELARRRRQQLESGDDVTSHRSGIGGNADAPGEYDAAFNAFADKAKREAAR